MSVIINDAQARDMFFFLKLATVPFSLEWNAATFFMFLIFSLLLFNLAGSVSSADFQKTYLIDGHVRLDWRESVDKCRASGMELVSIESREESQLLRRLIEPSEMYHGQKVAEMNFWTGGYLGSGNVWFWVGDGHPIAYTDWAPGFPGDATGVERCLRLSGHHRLQWGDTPCSAKLHYICQKCVGCLVHRLSIRHVKISPESRSLDLPPPPRAQTTPASSNSVVPGTPTDDFYSSSYTLTMHKLNFVVFQSKSVSWDQARDACSTLGLELAGVATKYERRRLVSYMKLKKLNVGCYWMRDLDPLKNFQLEQNGPCHEDYHRSYILRVRSRYNVSENEFTRIPGTTTDGRRRIRNSWGCPLLDPLRDVVMYRQCLTRCSFICEQINDFINGST